MPTKTAVTPVDPWETDKATWQYASVPAEDPLGKTFPTVRLNKYEFKAGETYHLPKEVAAYVNDRVTKFNRSCVRLLQPEMAAEGIKRSADGSLAAAMPSI